MTRQITLIILICDSLICIYAEFCNSRCRSKSELAFFFWDTPYILSELF